ncbi:DUF2255 family protein [Pontibacter diazotrophicus]|uniref:DUF2255 family protein n=1 Tax=Pontibacter diazotrophicus TaxID=1400979 RepID=A0A3D8LC38_9BACT|nr:DUF2255 family protein [Pontibacter diazotrophicus]RDV15011.1 DUF2255 family protein [Pontibacter diazotrophicus]
MADFDQETLAYIRNNNLIGIKAGSEREKFLPIWKVLVDDRVFARSWGFGKRSWFNTFLNNANGQIQCGDKITAIRASIPEESENLQERISQAYLDKYDKGENSFYARGIIKPEHVAKTMEFKPVD